MKITIKELVEKTGIDQATCNAMMKFMRMRGYAKICEKRKGGRGKPINIYEVDESFNFNLLEEGKEQ